VPCVRAVAGHGVVGVDDGDDAGAKGNTVALEAVGVAGAVEALVVVVRTRSFTTIASQMRNAHIDIVEPGQC